jgi:NADPH-dependent 2,4-dienoyl-CoA reductase/sulfur reductase-like enzyme
MPFAGVSKEVIHEVVESYGIAARRAVESGFDCVEFHAGHGYSPHSFLSRAMNQRTDEYGGSLENRARYLLECISSIRASIPADMPLLMRTVSKDDYVENGLTIEDIVEFCKMARNAGVDVLDVSRGNKFPIGAGNFDMKLEVPPIDLPRGFNIENAARIKSETGMPTIGVGRINSPDQAEEILAAGKADLVVIGRGQIADPEFCNKALAGDDGSIVRCIGCNQGCYDGIVNPQTKKITCLRNPAVGREEAYTLKAAASPKRVLVAGGGMAGLEAAIALKLRGHEPILFEESSQLGGQFLLAGIAPRKWEMREAAISRGYQAKSLGIDIRLNSKVTREAILGACPDAIIIATGAQPIKPSFPGLNLPSVFMYDDVLEGKKLPEGDTAVIGGGLVGLEVAEFLAEKGSGKVTVVEMLDAVGKDLGMLRRVSVLESMAMAGIETVTGAKCKEIRDGEVLLEKGGEITSLPCKNAVIAISAASRDYSGIENAAKELGIPFFVLGDAVKARRALNAIAEAAEVARAI